MSAKKGKKTNVRYNERILCADIAASDLTVAEISAKHKISASMVYGITQGNKRPELREEIDALVEAATGEAQRVLKSKARWAAERLVAIAASTTDEKVSNLDIALKATLKILEFAGLTATPAGGNTGKMVFTVTYR